MPAQRKRIGRLGAGIRIGELAIADHADRGVDQDQAKEHLEQRGIGPDRDDGADDRSDGRRDLQEHRKTDIGESVAQVV
jgi:hypothetical protein